MGKAQIIKILTIFGIVLMGTVAISWVAFPGWRTSVGNLWSLVILAAGALLTFAKQTIDLLKGLKDITPAKPTSPLKPVSADQLLKNYLPGGGQVAWIERNLLKPSVLSKHRRIAIVGSPMVGKTRQALELIRRAEGDLIPQGRIFELDHEALKTMGASELQTALRQALQSQTPLLLFIDHLSFHYSGDALKRLSDGIGALVKDCPQLYLVITARQEMLEEEHQKFLADHEFKRFTLPKLEKDQAENLVYAGAGLYQLQLERQAVQTILERSRGIPEIIIYSLRRLQELHTVHIDAAQVIACTDESIEEFFIHLYQDICRAEKAAGYLLQSLAVFHAARVTPYTTLVFAYAAGLWPSRLDRWLPGRTAKALHHAMNDLKRYDFSIVEHQIVINDDLIERALTPEIDGHPLTDFLENHRRLFHNRFLRPFYPAAAQHADALFDLALEARSRQDHAQAVLFYTIAIRVRPHPWYFSNRGNRYAALGEHSKALEDYSQALELNPKYATAFYNRGIEYAALGEQQKALEDYTQAIELDPKLSQAYSNRGLLYAERDEHRKALKDYTQAIKLAPKDSKAYSNRGNSYAALGERLKAQRDHYKAIELDPRHANRDTRYGARSEHRRAKENFSEAIELDPENASSYISNGEYYAAMGEHSKAVEDFTRAIELDPKYATAYSDRGVEYAALGEQKKALEDYTRAIELNPKYATAYSNRGVSYIALGKHSKALEDYTTAIQLDPKDATAYYNMACAYAILGEVTQVCHWLQTAIQMDNECLDMARTDKDFDGIRSTPEFQSVVQRNN